MNHSIYRFNLDIGEEQGGICLNLSRGDTHRRFVIGLCQKGESYPLSQGCKAVFFAKKPDGSLLFNDCRIEDGRIVYDMTSQTSAAAGILECCVRVYGQGEEFLLTSPTFNLKVLEGVDEDSAVESKDEFTALTQAIYRTHALMDATEEVRSSTLAVKEEVEAKLESGAFMGPKGDKGDKGDAGSVGNCVQKTATMTNPVGVDQNGQLWSEGIPESYLTEEDIGQSVASLGEDGRVPSSQLPFIPVSSKSLDITLSSGGWSGDSLPYTQTVAAEGVTPTANGLISLSSSATAEQRRAARNAMLSLSAQSQGQITVVADGYQPTVDIPVTLIILG